MNGVVRSKPLIKVGGYNLDTEVEISMDSLFSELSAGKNSSYSLGCFKHRIGNDGLPGPLFNGLHSTSQTERDTVTFMVAIMDCKVSCEK